MRYIFTWFARAWNTPWKTARSLKTPWICSCSAWIYSKIRSFWHQKIRKIVLQSNIGRETLLTWQFSVSYSKYLSNRAFNRVWSPPLSKQNYEGNEAWRVAWSVKFNKLLRSSFYYQMNSKGQRGNCIYNRQWELNCLIARDAMAAMLVVKNYSLSLRWELNLIFMQIMRNKIVLFWPPTWPPCHLSKIKEFPLKSWLTAFKGDRKKTLYKRCDWMDSLNFVIKSWKTPWIKVLLTCMNHDFSSLGSSYLKFKVFAAPVELVALFQFAYWYS